MTTLKDVAARAGVSIRTVSNVVNDWPHIRPELRSKVQAVIDEMGYEPNLAARNLRSGRTGLIGVVVPEIDVPYFAELTRALIDECAERGLTVVVEQTDGLLERERELIGRTSRAMLFDGIIMSPVAMSSAEVQARRSAVPIVLIGEEHPGVLDQVLIDNAAAAQAVTQHLLEIGRRRIALVGPEPLSGLNTSRLRTEGYKAALRSAGIPIDPVLIRSTRKFHRADGAAAVRTMLECGVEFDAICGLNDLLALGAMRALLERGKRVPEDVAVIGFDDVEDGRYSTPTLSSVGPDKRELARRATSLLVDRMGGSETSVRTETVPFQLHRRESTSHR